MGQMKKTPINTMVGAIHKKADQVKSRLLRGGTATETRSCWAIVAIHGLLRQNKASAGSTAYVDYRVKQFLCHQEVKHIFRINYTITVSPVKVRFGEAGPTGGTASPYISLLRSI
jgi:hypothetical protein